MPETACVAEVLPELLQQSLRCVIAAEHYRLPEEAALRIDLREVCERARRDEVRAEHLLIVLKNSWRALPEWAALPRFEADEALGRVISACINEYYQDPEMRTSTSPFMQR